MTKPHRFTKAYLTMENEFCEDSFTAYTKSLEESDGPEMDRCAAWVRLDREVFAEIYRGTEEE